MEVWRTNMVIFLAVLLLSGFLAPGFCEGKMPKLTVKDVTGQLKVTKPDGTVMTILPGDVPLEIPFGSTVETVSGTAKIDVYHPGFGISSTTVLPPGSAAKISLDKDGRETFSSSMGTIKVVVGEETAIVEEGEAITLQLDTETGECRILASKGDITIVHKDGTVTVLKEGEPYSAEVPSGKGLEPGEEEEWEVEGEPTEPEPIEGSPYLPD